MVLFHYHLVTSKVRQVEARYLGKLGFELVARYGRVLRAYASCGRDDKAAFDLVLKNNPTFVASTARHYLVLQEVGNDSAKYLARGKAGFHELLTALLTGKGTFEQSDWAWDELFAFVKSASQTPVRNPLLSTYWIKVFTAVAIYAVVALGLNVLMGRVGLVSLGQIAVLALGAWVAAKLLFDTAYPQWMWNTVLVSVATMVKQMAHQGTERPVRK